MEQPQPTDTCRINPLLQLRVLRFGLLEDRDVGIGVFPEGEEVLVGGAGLGCVALQSVSAGEAEMGKSADGIQPNAATVGDFLELACGLAAFTRCR